MNHLQFRHELKYYINMADYLTIKSRMSAFAEKDRHVSENGTYKIRSLYFETPTDRVLMEKINGVNNREKFRIRMYNDDPSFIRLEKKTKINGFCNKIDAPVTQEQCEQLLAGKTQWMKESEHALLAELYSKMKYEQLRPKTIVDYIREPFIYHPGNVRVTLDSEIKTGIHVKDMFNPEMPTIRTNGSNVIILEVKYDNFIPTIVLNAVSVQNRKSTAFSKYAVARLFG
ncbi:polyphosphate polymerase domain-containing protein [Methanimicrococcus sp. OttesenSCG-928-J09]|nr:polyphosphate polymerase domain-containing protein [Methanimicrococcus sp. OttesenSCG-928-J09]